LRWQIKRLDLNAFAERPLLEPFPYLIHDARYEKVREAGIVMSQAVLIAVGIAWDGRRPRASTASLAK
jgi:putative transposase